MSHCESYLGEDMNRVQYSYTQPAAHVPSVPGDIIVRGWDVFT